ncbi:hypothetical protein [Paractinoplanes toevensis]|uniref:Uncharacterized protein n=1 Tax=Paractinoplanes toevensis TaxID=571911 RepID=A0A919WDM7_9ACTN|nr:hypothetical protein [Actinoplanes toevensis]GIM98223.1 hypothetical protein Ato02nite_100160 [Actinoplanes toevensis]
MSSTGIGRRRNRAEAEPADDPRFAGDDRDAGAPGGPAVPGGRRGARPDGPPRPPSRGKARYNEVKDDWREHTGSWAAEPDTSSWTRDPDTGQWTRSDDDPRVQAWREEAARRDSAHPPQAPRRELPAGPSTPDDDGRGARRRSDSDGDDWRNPPSQGGGPAPRSAMPSSAPRSAMPSNSPRSATPYGTPPPGDDFEYPAPGRGQGGPSSSPRSGPAYGSTPRRALPSGRELPSGRGRPDDTTAYGSAPTSDPTYGGRGPAYDDDPGRDYDGGPAGGPVYGSAAPASGPVYGGGAAPASGPAYGTPRRALPSGRARPDDTTTFGAAPAGGPAYGDGPVYGGGAAPASGPAYGGGAPAGGPAYGSGAAPASGPAYGTPRRELPSGRARVDEPGAAPSSLVPYGPGNAPRSGVPYGAPGNAPRSGVPYGTRRRADEAPPADDWRRDLDPSGAGRRAVDEPTGADDWRRDLDPSGSGRRRAEEPPAAADWRRDLDPEGSRRLEAATEAPSWTLGDPANKDLSSWRLDENTDTGRGSAVYRESGGDDWRRDLADPSDLADGESRRFGTSDYVPFRSSGSAAVQQSANLSAASTSLISPVPRDQRDPRGFQGGMTGSYERRPVTGSFPTIRKSDLLDPDEEDDQESGGPLAAVGYTVIWYGVPIVLFIIYMLVANSGSQSHALDTLASAAPQFLISLVLSVLVAVGIRRFSSSWKAISVGLAAAVVGGGLATVLASAITGNSLS